MTADGPGSFLKWVGGKTRLAGRLAALAPPRFNVYREPFMGSAALYFRLRPSIAVLSDTNAELIHAFRAVKTDPEAVMTLLDISVTSKDHYLRVRSENPEALSEVKRGARLIYLNKTGFRGLWRVNRRGEMNVPWGAYDRPLYNRSVMLACASALQGAAIHEMDFEPALNAAQAGDFVYVDPPYVPAGGFSDFKRYTPEQFHDNDHERLAEAMKHAAGRGVFVLMTNSDTPRTREIFADFRLDSLSTRRDVNLYAARRNATDLLASNYVLPEAAHVQ